MIFGVVNRNEEQKIDRERFEAVCLTGGRIDGACHIESPHHSVAFANLPSFRTRAYLNQKPVCSSDQNLALVFTGQVYNRDDLARAVNAADPADKNLGSLILRLYRKYGNAFVEKINGKFAYAIWDRQSGNITLGRDRLGIEPLYYAVDDDSILFSSAIEPILSYRDAGRDINYASLTKFLLFGYNPSLDSFYKDISKLRGGHLMHVRPGKRPEFERYWKLEFGDELQSSEEAIAEELRNRLQKAVQIRMDDDSDYGIFVSGGMDSSSVLGFSAQHMQRKAHTFSYRCRGESFDESPYSRLMAESVGSVHEEIEYRPDDVSSMTEITNTMDEPFCDVGINIATYLLGKAAGNAVPYVLTGDGGDELFAGHPVYEADKIARFIDPVPSFLKQPIFALGGLLPDSDQKKNITVKIKRFAESMRYPPELLSHRWRIYYRPSDIEQLLSADAQQAINGEDLYADMLRRNREAHSGDFLSRCLYSDYHTVMDFYLRRNDINRCFGLETRYPMLDHELIEYCARIPMSMKIKGWFDTKHIFRKSMEPVLPHKIVHREDKLGHSIPLKNWMRDKPQVKDYILDHLSAETIAKRGIFEPSVIAKMIDEHMSKKRNNSHRLWTLAVLEMWMRKHG